LRRSIVAENGFIACPQKQMRKSGGFEMMRGIVGLCFATAGMVCAAAPAAWAVEGAVGIYLLGSKGSLAGVTPPPGIYLQSDDYFYSGDAGASRTLPFGGAVVAGIDADAYYKIATGLWVLPDTVLGGNFGLGISLVGGWKGVSASVIVDPVGGIDDDDDTAAFGDPILSAQLGWNRGNWHWNVGTLINVPIGQWDEGQLANLGFNRWAVDLNGAVTWLDPASGFEISGAVGVTFNFENPTTDYKSGTELHLEFAAVQNFSKRFALGVAGYHYDQLSGDSGPGARLGPFEGLVTAIGPLAKYNFDIGLATMSSNLRWFAEFDTRNRLEGNAVLLTLSLPLSSAPPEPEASASLK
jgi:hypothetical protein